MTKMAGYVWWCGDEWCDCYQPRIVRQHVNNHGYRIWEAIWEGQFQTDSQWAAANNELNRTAQTMRRKWHEAYTRIEWPWGQDSQH